MFRYVCDECTTAKQGPETYCLCRQPYDEARYDLCCCCCLPCDHCRNWTWVVEEILTYGNRAFYPPL